MTIERRKAMSFLLTGVMCMALWAKGQSGNPSGRPKEAHELRDLARMHGPAAIACLAKIMADDDAPHPSRVAAASILLDRGYGKAIQPTLVAVAPFEDMDDGALMQQIMRKAAELGVDATAPRVIEHEPVSPVSARSDSEDD